jgi:hypothetical protein
MVFSLRVLIGALVLGVAVVPPSPARAERAGDDRRADLAALQGKWVLDPEGSEEDSDPYKPGRSRTPRRPVFGPGPGGPLSGPGMGGPITGGGRREYDPEDAHRMRQLADLAFDDANGLEIVVEGDTVAITDGAQVQRLRADGAKRVETTAFGLQLERKTRWDDGRLVTEVKIKGGGGKSKQTWSVHGTDLVVATEIETDNAPSPLKMRRVFEREAVQ